MKAPVNRMIACLVLLGPGLCLAVGWESCHLHGELGGETITLEYIEDGAYGAAGGAYGYCEIGDRASMTCAPSKGAAIRSRYQSALDQDGLVYVCATGCGPDVVQQFRYTCEDDC